MKVMQVKPLDIYKLQITFNDGVTGEMDLTPTRPWSVFQQLEKDELRKYPKITDNGSAIYRNDSLDIDGLGCYIAITGQNPFND